MNPNLLAQHLSTINLTFSDNTINDLNSVSKCTAIEGIEVSDEQLGAIREAAHAQADDDMEMIGLKEELQGFGGSGIGVQES